MTTVYLEAGYKLTILADATSHGYYYNKGNPGEASQGLTNVTSNSSTVIGPFNENTLYDIISNTGRLVYAIELAFIEELAQDLNQLGDVVITNPLEDDSLVFDGTNWINTFVAGGGGASELDQLTDVEITTPVNRDALLFNNATSDFENRPIVEADISDLQTYITDITDEALDDLEDVNIVTPSDGEVLVYDSGVWINYDLNLGTMASEIAAEYSKTVAFSTVAFTGSYTDLSNKPTLGTLASQDGTFSGTSSGTNTGDQDLSGLVPKTYQVIAGTGMTGGGALSGNVTLNCSITQYTDEMVDDRVNGLFVNGTFISKSYNDGSNTFTVDLSASGTPDNTKFLRGDNTWAVPSGASAATIFALGKVFRR